MKNNPIKRKELTDKLLFESIKKGDKHAFEILFHSYYSGLCQLSSGIVKNDALAEEIVSDVFFNIWVMREKITIRKNLHGYLQYMTRNSSINRKKTKNIVCEAIHEEYQLTASEQNPEEQLLSEEILNEWEEKINNLPPQRQKVFRMNKLEGLTYAEIASYLNLSEKTVRNQVQLAQRTLEFTLSVLLISIQH